MDDAADGCQRETVSTEGERVHEFLHARVDAAGEASLYI